MLRNFATTSLQRKMSTPKASFDGVRSVVRQWCSRDGELRIPFVAHETVAFRTTVSCNYETVVLCRIRVSE